MLEGFERSVEYVAARLCGFRWGGFVYLTMVSRELVVFSLRGAESHDMSVRNGPKASEKPANRKSEVLTAVLQKIGLVTIVSF